MIQQLHQMDVLAQAEEDLSVLSLIAASHHGHLDCVEYFVSKGMDVNSTDEDNATPLIRAAAGSQVKVIEWLLENGADPCIRETREGEYNALDYGAGRSAEVARLLIERCGFSPAAMIGAASFGNDESFDILVAAGKFPVVPDEGADVRFWDESLTDAQRDVILQSIARGGNGGSKKILSWLLNCIPESETVRHDIRNSLHDAVLGAITEKRTACFAMLVKALLGDSTDVTNENRDLLTFLFLEAAASDVLDFIGLFLTVYGVDVNGRDRPHQTTALYTAANHDATEVLHLLAEFYGADIHQASGKYANGPTALWLAVNKQLERSVRMLLRYGGPVEEIDPSVEEGVTKRIYISAGKAYRSPVKLHAEMDPEWDDEHSRSRFLCLEFPDGWLGGVQLRKSDEELKDERELRLPEDTGFVVV